MEVKGEIPLMRNKRRKRRNQSPLRTEKSQLLRRRRRRNQRPLRTGESWLKRKRRNQSLKLQKPHRRIKGRKMKEGKKRKLKRRNLKSL
jgi:hypothetical protein